MGAADLLPRAQAPPVTLGRRLFDHVRDPLRRDAYALVLNAALTAGAGLLYWIVAAQSYSAYTVGLNSALISAMMFLAGLAGLNLPNILVRFLGSSGTSARRFVTVAYAVSLLTAALAAVVFLAGVSEWAPRLRFLGGASELQAWFVASTCAWGLFVIQDSVLTAMGRAVWVPVENGFFSLAKLGLVAAFAAALPAYGIFASWTAAMVLSVIGVNVLLFTRVLPARKGHPPAVFRLRDRSLARYFAADYVCGLSWLAATTLLPIVIIAAAGATVNAHFTLPWAVALPLYTVAHAIGTSLVVHGSAEGAKLPSLIRKATGQGVLLLLSGVTVIVITAPQLLSLFGAEYAREGTTLLRLLALAALPNLVITLALSVGRVRRRLGLPMVALVSQCVLSLGLVVPCLDRFGVTGAGVAWLTSQSLVAFGVAVHAGRGPLVQRLGEVRSWLRARAPGRSARLAARVVADATGAAPGPARPRRMPTDSDVAVFLDGPRAAPRAVVRIAPTAEAAQRLERGRRALAEVRGVPALRDWAAIVPAEVAAGRAGARTYLVETALPGVDGRRLAGDATRERALAATVEALGPLYAGTAASGPAATAAAWIDRRLRIVASAGTVQPRAIRVLLTDLREALEGSRLLTARVHGDLWLGNVLLAPDASRVTGLLDWEASEPAGLPAVDVAHLVVSTRSLVERRSIGAVTRGLLEGRDALTDSELGLVARADPAAIALDPCALARLAWLQHVSWRVSQCAGRPGRRWTRENVAAVTGA